MAEKMIRYRLFTYYEETDVLGQTVLSERHASFGEVVDVPRKEDIARGEQLDVFFSDEEREQIENGTFTGPEAELLAQPPMVEAFTDEEAAATRVVMTPAPAGEETATIDVGSADAAEIAEHIVNNKLNVDATVALAAGDKELAEKVYDAEVIASDSDPRKGVTEGLDAITSGSDS
jgi:hypothetical protein